ncbi:MAG: hypothetical protein RSB41_01420 [Bacilli bacterium]
MNQYLIPANTKKSQLIFGLFRWLDLIVFGSGALVTLALMFIIQSNEITALVIKLAPLAVCTFLVLPVPNYHNVLVFIQEIYSFITNRRIYLWKGWCVRNEYGKEDK